MRDLTFYNAGYHELRGWQRLTIPLRRLVRYLLRPVFVRQVELFQELAGDIDTLAHTQIQLAEELACQLPTLSWLQSELAEIRSALRAVRGELQDLRAEVGQVRAVACSDQQSRRLDGFEEEHLAIARRLAALEDGMELLRTEPSDPSRRAA